jgi:hypothetical protein
MIQDRILLAYAASGMPNGKTQYLRELGWTGVSRSVANAACSGVAIGDVDELRNDEHPYFFTLDPQR